MRAELRGIIEGMRLAWGIGIRKLCIQTDSRAAVALLRESAPHNHHHMSLVDQFHNLKNRDWEVTIHHIYREANNAADCLANFGHTVFFGSHVFSTPIDPLLYWLRYDTVIACLPRSINNTS
ncbi:Putative ribonuclease H protein At1g65750 [Linum perenne]